MQPVHTPEPLACIVQHRAGVVAESFLPPLRLSDDFVATVKVSVPWAVTADRAIGLDVSGGLSLLIHSGLGIYAEVSAAASGGAASGPTSGRSASRTSASAMVLSRT